MTRNEVTKLMGDKSYEKILQSTEASKKVESSRIMEIDEFFGIGGLTITTKEAQAKYGLSRYKIDKIAREKHAAIYIGNRKFLLEARIEEYLREQEERKGRKSGA